MINLISKVKHRYLNSSEPFKASIWFTICNVMQKGILVITQPIFTRIMSTEEYGTFSVYQSWYSIISIFATLSLYSEVFNNCLIKYNDKRDSVTSSIQSLSTTATLVFFLIYIANVNFWNNLLGLSTIFMLSMFLELLFVPAYSLWSVRQRFDYKYKNVIILTMFLSIGSSFLGIVAVYLSEAKAEARVVSYVFVQIIIGLLFYISNLSKGKTFFSKEYWSFALKFNLPLLPHYLSQTVLNQSDRIMISNMVGTSQAGIYSIAYSVSMLMNLLVNAINSSFIPYTYKCIKQQKIKSLRTNSYIVLFLTGIGSIAVMAFGPEIILLVSTREYYDAIWIIPPVAASVYFQVLYRFFGNIEFYFEETRFTMFASVGAAMANLLLNYVFIGIFGYYAAGYTTLACYILLAFLHYIIYRKIVNERMPDIKELYDIKTIVLISIFIIMGMVGMTFTYQNIVLRYSVLLILFVIILLNKNKIIQALAEFKDN